MRRYQIMGFWLLRSEHPSGSFLLSRDGAKPSLLEQRGHVNVVCF